MIVKVDDAFVFAYMISEHSDLICEVVSSQQVVTDGFADNE